MAEDYIPRYAALLREHYLFEGLNEAQIAHVVTRVESASFDADEVIITEGDTGEFFYLIYQGHVHVTREERQRERELAILGPGDYFGEEALLFARPRTATVTALEPVSVLKLSREAFQELLNQFPQMRLNLSATAESRTLAQKENFDWIGREEVIYLIVRKHEFFLWLSLLPPVILAILMIPLLAIGFSGSAGRWAGWMLTGGLVGIVLAVAWLVWNWLDWGNDFYVVTDQRVMWMEKVIALYNSRREAPMNRVLAVNIKSSWLGRIIGYGDIDVRTFTGSILMRRAAQPHLFARFVEGFQHRAKQRLKEAEAEAMDLALRQRLGLPPKDGSAAQEAAPASPTPPQQEPPASPVKAPKTVQVGSLGEKISTFLQVRYEKDGVITYRKHWLMLLRRIWLPSILLLGLIGTGIYLMILYFEGRSSLVFSPLIMILVGLLYLVLAGWWTYNYLDWSNDIYQLAPDQIRDIERRPLGDEQKKTAPLESILSLEHTRDGIIQLVFNFGNVIINVGQTQFIFRGVYNPDQVHQDVSDYIEVLARKKQEAEAKRDRERMADWFSTYRRHSKLLEEMDGESDWDLFPG